METLIEAIRSAIAEGANDETRATGATACRTILTALEAKAGEPLVLSAPPAPTEPAATEPAPKAATPALEPEKVAAFIGALRNVPIDQLLDLAIQRLRVALPKDAAPAPVAPLKFRILPIAPLAKSGSTDRSMS